MRRACLFLLLILFGLNSLKPDLFEQLQRIPNLISHYKHHTLEEKEQLSFLSFLKIHYIDDTSHKEEENHEELPLFSSCFSHYHVLVVQEQMDWAFSTRVEPIEHTDTYRFHYSYSASVSIFQPPKNQA
ncbi:MAG: hypothetical protein LCH37_15435 [Bacteroidetes bacterium]|nr:hypothetical protein [Bacteroidota bacterium]MCK6610856.1 hypothetical protein [Bacteroidia bacterium]